MTHQWIRVTSGKPGRGHVGYIVRQWKRRGTVNTLIRFTLPYPRDFVGKADGTFERLSETECLAMEIVA